MAVHPHTGRRAGRAYGGAGLAVRSTSSRSTAVAKQPRFEREVEHERGRTDLPRQIPNQHPERTPEYREFQGAKPGCHPSTGWVPSGEMVRLRWFDSSAWGWWPTRGAREADAPSAQAGGRFRRACVIPRSRWA